MTAINIYRGTDVIYETPINIGAKGYFSVKTHDYIILPFSNDRPIDFKLGDYVDLEGILDVYLGGNLAKRYEIVDLQKPTYNVNTGGYDYNLRLDAYYWKWKNKIFKYTPETHGNEASWSLTAPLDIQMGVFLRNLKTLGYKYKDKDFEFVIDSTIENKAVAMAYDNTNLLDALFRMGDKDAWDCDVWVTDNIIHFGRNEFGDAVKIERDIEAQAITRNDSQGTYATRIYAFGSTRNIPSNYRQVDEQVVVSGVVQRRLMLPEDTPYIDAYEGMGSDEIVETVVVFDDVYPRRVGTVSDVHTRSEEIENEDGSKEKITYYRYKDTGFTFDEKYILEGEELKIEFQSGKLNGMKFGVIFNPSPKDSTRGEQLWEIVRNEDYGRPLPDDILKPENGDKYVLSGLNIQMVSDVYIPAAEQELKEKAQKYADKAKKDDGTYPVTLRSDWVETDPILRTFEFGQRINLIDDTYFPNGRISRVLGWELNLDIPYDSPIYIIGESLSYSKVGEIEDKVDSLTYKGQTYTGFGGSGVYLIRANDTTPPSDSNVFSARRSMVEFLSKIHSDTASDIIKFLKGILFGNGGSGIDGNGNGKLLSLQSPVYNVATQTGYGLTQREDGKYGLHITDLEVWGRATFNELEIRKLSYVGGNFVFSPAGSKIVHVEEVSRLGTLLGWRCYFLADDGTTSTTNMWKADDQALCETFNVQSGVSYLTGNKRYWRRVAGVSSENVQIYDVEGNVMYDGMKFAYINLSASDCEQDSDIPAAGDTVCCMGNRTDIKRQNAITVYTTGDEAPAIIEYKGIHTYSLDGCNKTVISPTLGSKFVGKSFVIETESGAVRVPADRGEWQAGETYYYYDRVSYGGNLWLCTVPEGQSTTEEPADGSEAWLKQTDTGDSAFNIIGNGQDVIVPADGVGHPLFINKMINFTLMLGQKQVYVTGTKFNVDISGYHDFDDIFSVDEIIQGSVDVLLDYHDMMNEQTFDLLIEEGRVSLDIKYKDSENSSEEKTQTVWFNLVKVRNGANGSNGADGKDGENGKDGADGADAWNVVATPSVISIETDKNGQVGTQQLANAMTTISVTRGNRTISNVILGSPSTEHCTVATGVTNSTVKITAIEHYKLNGKQIAYGSGYMSIPVTATDGGDTYTTDVRVGFVVSVVAQSAQLKVEQDAITATVTELTNNVDTLTKSYSEIKQTAENISLKVDKAAVSGRNMLENSYVRQATNVYGIIRREITLEAGKKYTLSVNGHIDRALKNDGRRLSAFIWSADSSGNWTWSVEAKIESLTDTTSSVTFSLPDSMSGSNTLNFAVYPYMSSESSYPGVGLMTVNWVQLEEGDIATPWSPASSDALIQGNLLPLIDKMAQVGTFLNGTQTSEIITGGYTDGAGQVLDVLHAKNAHATTLLDACRYQNMPIGGNTTYTLSFMARGTGNVDCYLWNSQAAMTIAVMSADGTVTKVVDGHCQFLITSEWKQYSLTWTTVASAPSTANVIPVRLFPGSEAWVCAVKLEQYGRKTEYTLKGVTEKDLLATGIDIENKKVTVTANQFEVRNNNGEVTAKVNEDGVLETTDGIFKGTVKADSGYFNNGKFDKGTFTDANVTGVIDATRGSIGGWVFVDKNMASGTIVKNLDGTYSIKKDSAGGLNLYDNYIEFTERDAALKTDLTASIGTRTIGGTASIPVLGYFRDTGTDPTGKTGLYFVIKNGGRYNLAFRGEANAMLNGFMDGVAYDKAVLNSANSITGISIKRSNRIFISKAASGAEAVLPQLTHVWDTLALDTDMPFAFRLTVHGDINTINFNLFGRNNTILSGSSGSRPWSTNDYPLLINPNGNYTDKIAMGAGDMVELLLVYDPDRASESMGGYNLAYTARIISLSQ